MRTPRSGRLAASQRSGENLLTASGTFRTKARSTVILAQNGAADKLQTGAAGDEPPLTMASW
ncbi:MAG: hypothetical protein IT425_03925 [Pirellulales bacterium]|nr:hypothetical protein [Pirellulales bacterium]